MRAFRSTGLWFVIVLAVGVLTYFEYKKSLGEDEEKLVASRIFGFKADEILTFSRKSKEGELKIRKDQDVWLMDSPVQDEADASLVFAFLDELEKESGQKLPAVEGGFNWANYGLDQPETEWSIQTPARTYEFAVSGRPAFDGSYYLRFEDQLYLAGRNWSRHNAKPADTLRDNLLLRGLGSLKKFQRLGPLGFRLKKVEDAWKLEGSDKSIDPLKLERVLAELRDIKAIEIMSSVSPGAFGLSKPNLTLSLHEEGQEKARTLELGLGKNADETFVRSNKKAFVYRVSPTLREKLDLTADDFREGKFPFQFDLEKISEVQIKTASQSIKLKKNLESWTLEGDEKLDETQLANLFQRLRDLDARSFYALSSVPIGSLKNSLLLLDQAGERVFEMKWGADFQVSSGRNKDQKFFRVLVSGQKEAFGLSLLDLNSLPIDKLIVREKINEDLN